MRWHISIFHTTRWPFSASVKYKPLPFARTADSQAHSRVFCGEFGTNFAKYFKPEGFYYCKPAGLWWPICSHIQIDLTDFHQGKVVQEISSFLHLCVAGLSGPVDWHWLWGIVMGHCFNALLLSSVVLARHAPEQMILNIVCRLNGQ